MKFQFGKTALGHKRGAARNPRDFDSASARRDKPETIAHVESLQQAPVFIESETAVGENAIDIEREQFDLCPTVCFGLEFLRVFQCRVGRENGGRAGNERNKITCQNASGAKIIKCLG